MNLGKLNEDNGYDAGTFYQKVVDKLISFAQLTHPPKIN